MPIDFTCPITLQIMRDPHFIESGHSFEKEFIEKWVKKHRTNPLTNEQLKSTEIKPNINLKNAI